MSNDQNQPLGFTLQQLLKVMLEKGASDLHITVNQAPLLRIDGAMIPLKLPPLAPAHTRALAYEVLNDEQKQIFEAKNELDFSFTMKQLARFRGNLYVQRASVGAVFRFIPYKVKSYDELGLPPILGEICEKSRGLVLVTGATGSGKSTTLAAMIDKINNEQRVHIVTIEDPIEFVHTHKRSLVNQREVGSDTKSFAAALKHVLRQDPDVVLLGEMRDLETIEAALTIAETGHLVFGTLHTNSAIQSINRIINVFPPHQQTQVRAQLSLTLQAVVSQTLLPNARGPGRCLALEVLIPNAAIRNLMREDKLHQVYSAMQVGQAGSGMQTMNQCLIELLMKGSITPDVALSHSNDPGELRALLESPRGGAPRRDVR
ncbi:MAG TPA: type IV pilus twitching motility protein PilT [Polyangiaceae bacterium]|jgi:twitching motility protein PilT|nr:type IV pilus twitching motility protein PilT [Polyangiaceae bacterium]